MQHLISSIIIHFERVDYTVNVVRQLQSFSEFLPHEIIVVDNASDHPFPPDAVSGVKVLRISEHNGYGYACNRGVEAASGDFFFILNNDLDFQENPLPLLLHELTDHARVGAVGPALRFPDGRYQPSWSDFPTLFNELRERKRQKSVHAGGGSALERQEPSTEISRSVDWITGACMLLPRQAWEAVDGFDEAYYFYLEDVDLCTRLQRCGFDIRFQPGAQVVHFGGGSEPLTNPRIVLSYRREQLRYYARYNSALSFFLLKRYLRWKFQRMERGGSITKDLARQVKETIRTFSRTDERRRFRATERMTA